MNTDVGRQVKGIIWDYNPEQVKDFLEATFPPGDIGDEEAGDLCLLSDLLEAKALTLEEAYLDDRQKHEVRFENFILKLKRRLNFHQKLRGLLPIPMSIIYLLVCFYCPYLMVGIIGGACLVAAQILVIKGTGKVINGCEDILFSDEDEQVRAYNEDCYRERRSLDVMIERPPEVKRWLRNANVLLEFIRTRNAQG